MQCGVQTAYLALGECSQVLGARLGVALRWRDEVAEADAASADGSAAALSLAGAREVAGPLEVQAMLCAAARAPASAAAGEPGLRADAAGSVLSGDAAAGEQGGGDAWAAFAAMGPARVHLSGAEVAAAAAVAGGAAAEAERGFCQALPARTWPQNPAANPGEAGLPAAGSHAWLAEILLETRTLQVTYASGGSAAALVSTPPPAAFLSSPTAAAAACLSCRDGAQLLLACDSVTVAAAAAGPPDPPALGDRIVLAATLAQAGLWAGARLGATAAAVDLGIGFLPGLPRKATRQGLHSSGCAAAPGGVLPGAALPPPVRARGPGAEPSGAADQGACPRSTDGPPQLLAAGAVALARGACRPALVASPVCLLLGAADSGAGARGSGGGRAEGGAAARVAVSVESVSGALGAQHLQALVRKARGCRVCAVGALWARMCQP